MYVDTCILDAKRNLSEIEKAIIDLRAQGNTYMQISNQLHVTKKKVEYTLKKVRNNKRKNDELTNP